jgi:hypothetical protein
MMSQRRCLPTRQEQQQQQQQQQQQEQQQLYQLTMGECMGSC